MTPLSISETLLLSATIGATFGYGVRKFPLNLEWIFPQKESRPKVAEALSQALRFQSEFGYNPHSLVSLQPESLFWLDEKRTGAVIYQDIGRVWLAAGEPLGSIDNLGCIAQEFSREARAKYRYTAFLPTTEAFTKSAIAEGFDALKIGASPYFDLTNWNPRGDKAKKLRAGVNQAIRAGIRVEKVLRIDQTLKAEVSVLSKKWLSQRCAETAFGWLFQLTPFRYQDLKQYFTARDESGKLVGFLAASPIPAREGWYLEDVLRLPDAPCGTADLLVKETLNSLRDEGAKLATLGTVPFALDGNDELSSKNYRLLQTTFDLVPKTFARFYNFDGLRRFKAKFVPSFWESEYVVAPPEILAPPLIAHAFLRAILPKGFIDFGKKQILPRK